jgi:nucleotide-binding universal stress UspA family protein
MSRPGVRDGRSGVSIKSILAYLDPAANPRAVLEVAVELARRHRAHLVNLQAAPARVAESAAGSCADALQDEFQERATQVQLSHEWLNLRGNDERGVVLEARTHDLLVIGRAQPATRGLWPQPHHMLESALIKSGYPLIAVPYRGSFDSVGERILVAWNGAREVGRAVKDAMPILEKANAVTLLTVDHRSGAALSVDHLVTLLERHDVNVSVQGARSFGRPIGEVLLAKARDLHAGLLVMGGYGHSPLREHLFGGVTYFVLEHMDLPVLLSH